MNPFNFNLIGQNLLLLPQKAIYWQNQEFLLVSDIHLGKVGHFRKAGIPIPRNMEQEDLALLSDLIRVYKPKTLLILGDFFHSTFNQDWYWIRLWRDQFPKLKIILVKGNHDIISQEIFQEIGIEFIMNSYKQSPFIFTHEPPSSLLLKAELEYFLSGHIHPGISLRGKGNQTRRLPCFYFAEDQGILPAFGRFTGTSKMDILKKVHIFIVNGNSVLPLPSNPKPEVV